MDRSRPAGLQAAIADRGGRVASGAGSTSRQATMERNAYRGRSNAAFPYTRVSEAQTTAKYLVFMC